MANQSFRCRLVTPTASVTDALVKHVQLPAWDGSMGFLPGRAPLLARLGAGELRLDHADSAKGAGGSQSFFVEGGVAKMQGDELLILAEHAVPAAGLTVAQAESELQSAMAPKPGTKPADAKKAQSRARAKLALARRGGGGI